MAAAVERPSICSASPPETRSSSGTRSGGSAAIRSPPCVRVPSFSNALALSLRRAFLIALCTAFTCLGLPWDLNVSANSVASILEYQMSISLIPAKRRVASR